MIIIIHLFLFFFSVQTAFKSSTPNPDFQTDQVSIFNTLLINETSYYTITYQTSMTSLTASTAIGIVGSSFTMEGKQFGWDFYVQSHNLTGMIVEGYTKTQENTIKNIMIRYLAADQTYLDIDYANLTFDKTSSIGNASKNEMASCVLLCRQSSSTLTYTYKNKNGLSVYPYLVGFYVSDVPDLTEAKNLKSYPDYFGISLYASNINNNNFKIYITVYGFAQIQSISLYYISVERTSLITYYSRFTGGLKEIGCYYDEKSCGSNIDITSNTTFWTDRTYVDEFVDDKYFVGLSRFVFQKPGFYQIPEPENTTNTTANTTTNTTANTTTSTTTNTTNYTLNTTNYTVNTTNYTTANNTTNSTINNTTNYTINSTINSTINMTNTTINQTNTTINQTNQTNYTVNSSNSSNLTANASNTTINQTNLTVNQTNTTNLTNSINTTNSTNQTNLTNNITSNLTNNPTNQTNHSATNSNNVSNSSSGSPTVNKTNSTNNTDQEEPSPIGQFNLTNTFLAGNKNDQYQNQVQFTGNQDGFFTMRFTYVIYLTVDCLDPAQPYHKPNLWECRNTCGNKYYPDNSSICLKCDSICYKCDGPSSTQCLACYSNSQKRALNNGVCQCKDGFYDDGTDTCASCHYTCLTCFSSTDSSCSTCDSSLFRFDDGNSSCPCMDGYYDDGTGQCDGCYRQCKTCYDSKWNNCLTCDPANHRVLGSTDNCYCDEGYFNDGAALCENCHYSCKACQSQANNCTSCESTDGRTLNSNACQCTNNYFDNGADSACQICDSTCLTCNGPSESDCQSCDTSLQRLLEGSSCKCITSYYEFNKTCYSCHYSCENCTYNTRYDCLTCISSDHRTYENSTGQCICEDGYYDDNANSLCLACDYTCKTCQITSTNCTSCRTAHDRTLSGSNCPCDYGYIDLLFTGVCTQCHHSCQTCFDATSSGCVTCNTTIRDLVGGQCICKNETFDNGMIEDCLPCNEKCDDCINEFQYGCLTCNPFDLRQIVLTMPNYCFCLQRYYDSGVALCSSCHHSCLTCSTISTNCTSCDSNDQRVITASNTCDCITHYYEVGAQVCSVCSNECQNCTGLPNNCTTCSGLRVLNGTKCSCIDGYYEDLSGNCQICDSLCATCSLVSTNCLSCPTNSYRHLDTGSCVCNSGYFQGGSVVCDSCPYQCSNCTAGPICLTCPSSSHRTLTLGDCLCDQGYYDNGNTTQCQTCFQQCLECSTYSVCTNCDTPTHNRVLYVDECICDTGYFEVNGSVTCQTCHHSCQTCTGSSEFDCINCATNRDHNTTSGQCPCSIGLYQLNATCYFCSSPCYECQGSPTFCTNCLFPQQLKNNTCQCVSGYYWNGVSCSQCDSQCQECQISSSYCTKCYSSHGTVLLSNSCTCSDGYYKNSSNLVCETCHVSCLTCFGGTQNECKTCDSSEKRSLNNSTCECISGYYPESSSCQPCHSQCLACVQSSKYNCTSCHTGYILIASFCRLPLNCSNYEYDGNCVDVCPNTTYPTVSTHSCEPCTNNCKTCLSSTYCLSCVEGKLYNQTDHGCYNVCSSNSYSDSGSCKECPQTCSSCRLINGQVTCIECNNGTLLIDFKDCTDACPNGTHVEAGDLCLKCYKNCRTCSSLSTKSCLTCLSGYSLLRTECVLECPSGYYKEDSTCKVCESSCKQCYREECVDCYSGNYLYKGQCIELGYYLDENEKKSKCHLNCESCTDSSFSSCIRCNQFRGDESENAISGYCDCHYGSVDVGQGICDKDAYQTLQQSNQILISLTQSSFFVTSLNGMICLNFVPLLSMVGYVQLYSTFFYLNSSVLYQTDLILYEYLKYNPNTYLNLYEKQGRLLLSTQTQQSLFLRGSSFQYLYDWAIFSFIIIISIWTITFILYLIKKCCFDDEKKQEEQQQANKCKKYILKFYKYYHESVAICYHYAVSLQLTIFSTFWLKLIFSGDYDLDVGKTFGSVVIILYLFGYTIRLIVGGIREDVNAEKTSLLILRYMHKKRKTFVMYRLYIPLLILRNQIIAILVVSLSENPLLQISLAFSIYLLFTFYSLCFCPYTNYIRIFIHLQELFFLGQLCCLFVSTYYLTVEDGNLLNPSIGLNVLNYLQLLVLFLFTVVVLLMLIKKRICRKNEVINEKPENLEITQSQEALANNLKEEENQTVEKGDNILIRKKYKKVRKNRKNETD